MTIDPKNLAATATLTFGDEFNSLSLRNGSTGTWTTKYWWAGTNGATLSGNGEQEWYINHQYAPTSSVKPWTVNNGILTLTAAPAAASIQPSINNYKYTSGMITTYETFTQEYGYFEMRAQLPAGKGLWPAFWLLPATGAWPPEIDAMEVLGHDMTTLHNAVHTNQTGAHTSSGGQTKVPDMSAGYHTYGVDWQSDYITWYFDGQLVDKEPTPADLHQPMYIIANLAVGGYWPGNPDSTTPFPAQMKIDYIRAYADKGLAPQPTPPSPPVQEPPTTPPPSGESRPPRDGASRDTIRERRDDMRDDRDGSDRGDRGSRRDDTRDDRDESGTIRETRRDDTDDGTSTANRTEVRGGSDTMSGNHGHARYLMDRSAGSDTFTFDKNAFVQGGSIADLTVGTDILDHSADEYLSFPSDGAGSTKVDFDPDAAGTAHQSPWLIAALDNVGLTGVHMQADWVLH